MRSYTQIVRWIAIASVSVLVIALGLIYLRNELRSGPCGGGFSCPAFHAIDADIADDCRARGLDAMARAFRTGRDPYAVSWAYARKRGSASDASYWSCLDGLGVAVNAWAYWEPDR